MLLQYSSQLSVPTELTDQIIDFACSESLDDASSLGLVCHQCRNRAQGHLLKHIRLLPDHLKQSVFCFFLGAYHLRKHVRTISLYGPKLAWPEDTDQAISLLGGQSVEFVADGVYVRDLLSLVTEWSTFTGCRIVGSVYSAEELYAWLGRFIALKKLSMPKEGPNTLITPIGPQSQPPQLHFTLQAFNYHSEGGPTCLSDDRHFSNTILPTISRLQALELAVDEKNWTGVMTIFQQCKEAVADLDLKFHCCTSLFGHVRLY
ncbi:uncharacterized protein ARMOST_19887 [Armillaria ostoyae]|uniref:F-box domain-containing protein n=1 Tax=Armillaria ostoyae TaxID=47428 RepID=A0A284S5S5_ARMOS|nr:uncharacterized protein ARMOST_19887 [Armillaria ostoyae]